MTQLLGTITSLNASLTVAVFDARSADAWVPTKAAENKAQFTRVELAITEQRERLERGGPAGVLPVRGDLLVAEREQLGIGDREIRRQAVEKARGALRGEAREGAFDEHVPWFSNGRTNGGMAVESSGYANLP